MSLDWVIGHDLNRSYRPLVPSSEDLLAELQTPTLMNDRLNGVFVELDTSDGRRVFFLYTVCD